MPSVPPKGKHDASRGSPVAASMPKVSSAQSRPCRTRAAEAANLAKDLAPLRSSCDREARVAWRREFRHGSRLAGTAFHRVGRSAPQSVRLSRAIGLYRRSRALVRLGWSALPREPAASGPDVARAALFEHPVNSLAGDLLLNDRPGPSDYHLLKSLAFRPVKPVSVMVVPSPRLRMVLPPTTLAFFSTVLVS
jgi:hypothetical protein